MLPYTGVDLIEVERIRQVVARHGKRFLRRVFTARELAQVGQNTSSLAARFAAKEAVAKALCTGIGEVGWKDVEILRGEAREPRLHLHGAAVRRAEELGLDRWSVSLSHTREHAIAFVVALGKENKG